MIIASPTPLIDTYFVQKEAPLALLHGSDPYSFSYTRVYSAALKNTYGYWPVSIILQLPFVVIFHDPRILHILTDMGSALLIYFIGKRTKIGEVLALLYLFRPNSNFVIEQSWLTPTLFFFSSLLVFIILKSQTVKRNLGRKGNKI